MDLDLKNLTAKQDEALQLILARCRYLNGAMKYDLSETVIRSVAQELANYYGDLLKK